MGVALIRENDREFVAVLRLALRASDWRVEAATGRADFEHKLQSMNPDVVVIDVDRDEGDALVHTASIYQSVVIAITRDAGDERTIGLLELGADAVYSKPLAPDLMHARLNAAVRQRHRLRSLSDNYVFENLTVDLLHPVVKVNGEQLHLSATEHRLIRILAENAGRVLSHDQLLQEVWGEEYEGNDDLLRTFVSSLRRRLKEAGFSHEFIHTERALGYWVVRPPTEVATSPKVAGTEAETTRLAVREQRERLRAGMYQLQGSVEKLHQTAYRTSNPETPPASESSVTP